MMRERGAQKGLRGWWASLLVRPPPPLLPLPPPLPHLWKTGGRSCGGDGPASQTKPAISARFPRARPPHTPPHTTGVPPKIPKSTRNKGLPSSTPPPLPLLPALPPLPPAGTRVHPLPPEAPLHGRTETRIIDFSVSNMCAQLGSAQLGSTLSRSPVTGRSTCAPKSPLRRASNLDRGPADTAATRCSTVIVWLKLFRPVESAPFPLDTFLLSFVCLPSSCGDTRRKISHRFELLLDLLHLSSDFWLLLSRFSLLARGSLIKLLLDVRLAYVLRIRGYRNELINPSMTSNARLNRGVSVTELALSVGLLAAEISSPRSTELRPSCRLLASRPTRCTKLRAHV